MDTQNQGDTVLISAILDIANNARRDEPGSPLIRARFFVARLSGHLQHLGYTSAAADIFSLLDIGPIDDLIAEVKKIKVHP